MHTEFSRQLLRFFLFGCALEYGFPRSLPACTRVHPHPLVFQMPELQAQHDKAIMRTYVSKEADVETLKEEARWEWELRKHELAPDLALLIDADLKAGRSELKVGKESLRLTEASLLEATGRVLLSDEARQLLVMGVSISTTHFVLGTFLSTPFSSPVFSVPENVLCGNSFH